ncbi:putative quinol monooxygenase [Myroides odoratus]|uniref:putative quinol monooxygenase n=1 Tax=Myroides odoratus TaxID=256 RepID=UPI0039B10ED9
MNIYITAIVQAKPEYQKEVQAFLLHMVEETRKEDACLRYDLHQDLTDKNTFIFYEIWENQQGLDVHNQQVYIQEFGALVERQLQQKPNLYITRKI